MGSQWELPSGKVGQSYRSCIYYKGKRKYVYFTLGSSSERKVVTEALNLCRSKLNALEKGLPIGRDAKKLEHYISMFMGYMDLPVRFSIKEIGRTKSSVR